MMISRKALAEVGYFSTNNITEDHETGIKIQNAGYTCYAQPYRGHISAIWRNWSDCLPAAFALCFRCGECGIVMGK